MQAYALAGERGKAVQQFERCQLVLQEELGVDPAAATIKLFEDIQAGRLAPAASAESMRLPIKTRHNLPVETTPLIGREMEIVQLKRRIIEKKQRLVTIVAPGGMGKTRLALAVGAALLDAFPDGVYFVDLAPLAHAEEIPQTIAAVFDYQAPDKSQTLFPQLLKTLSQRNLLLILDNFEHLLTGVDYITETLQTCSQTSILVTSRQRLKLASEHRFELGGLQVPEGLTPEDAMDYTAVQLFVENGRRSHPDFALSDNNLSDVVRICQLVQGMPLGLLLAATWLEMLSPAEIVTEMEKGLDILEADLADLPPRQRSMQAVFEYSWRQMTPAEQITLAKLSVFRGGFTREAAEQVAGAHLRLLLALVNKSLLRRDEENGRFAMHELLRQFAANQRQQIDPDNETIVAHCRYFAKLAQNETRQAVNFYPTHLPQKQAPDRDNFWRAWDWALLYGLGDEVSDLIPAIEMFNVRQGMRNIQFVRQAMQALAEHGYRPTNRVMLHLELVAQAGRTNTDDRIEIKESLEQLIPLFQEQRHLDLLYWLYEQLASNANFSPLPNKHLIAQEWWQKALAVAVEIEDEALSKAAELRIYWHQILDPDSSMQMDDSLGRKLEALRAYFASHYPTSYAHYGILEVLRLFCMRRKLYEQALLYGKQNLIIATDWQDLLWISHAHMTLFETYTAMGQRDKLRLMILNDLEWHLIIGQIWQTLGCIWGIASRIEPFSSAETAVSLLSFVYHHPEVPLNYQQRIMEEDVPGFEAKLGTDLYTAAWEKGKQMDFETAVNLIRTALKS